MEQQAFSILHGPYDSMSLNACSTCAETIDNLLKAF